jgi:phage terminase large subunit
MEILLTVGFIIGILWLFSKLKSNKNSKGDNAITQEVKEHRNTFPEQIQSEEEFRKEAEEKVKMLISELNRIAIKYIDKTKEVKYYQNMYGQDIPDISFIEGETPFFEKDLNGKRIPDPRVVQIGWALHKLGGLKLMQYVYYQVIPKLGGDGPNLKWAWDNVGDWQP